MSRIGRLPIDLPATVTVEMNGVNNIKVTGPKGELARSFHPDMKIEKEDSKLLVSRPTDSRRHRALHGLTRALLANMVQGVTEGFAKRLLIVGVGYRAEVRGTALVLNVGYSHPVEIVPPPGISFSVDRTGRDFVIEGIDKELVGQVAAKVRDVRSPEPYKGKGIRYADEFVRIKAGKSGKGK